MAVGLREHLRRLLRGAAQARRSGRATPAPRNPPAAARLPRGRRACGRRNVVHHGRDGRGGTRRTQPVLPGPRGARSSFDRLGGSSSDRRPPRRLPFPRRRVHRSAATRSSDRGVRGPLPLTVPGPCIGCSGVVRPSRTPGRFATSDRARGPPRWSGWSARFGRPPNATTRSCPWTSESGSIDVLVLKDSAGARVPFILDEVVGVKLRLSAEKDRIPLALAVERPDVPLGRVVGRSSSTRRTVFLSDLHVGSKSFLGECWAGLIEFLREDGAHPDLARSIDSVVIAGDLVDGIGIYPRQERDLAIGDIVEQYAELGRRLSELPPRLTVIAVPGRPRRGLPSGAAARHPREPRPRPPEERAAAPEPVHVRARRHGGRGLPRPRVRRPDPGDPGGIGTRARPT